MAGTTARSVRFYDEAGHLCTGDLMSALDDAGREMRLRRAGRVIVLDPEDRVLLFRYDDGPPNGRH
jgi:hypothetical protein